MEITFLLAEVPVKLRRIVFSDPALTGAAMLSQCRVAMRSFCLFVYAKRRRECAELAVLPVMDCQASP